VSYQLPADFKPITLQRIFDLAWQAFVVEKRPPAQQLIRGCLSTGDPDNWTCKYLTSDARKCAIGLALPDGHRAQKLTVRAAILLHEHSELFAPGIRTMDINGLQARLHDDLAVNGAWRAIKLEDEYRSVAACYGLTIPGEVS
jgi:hypothetical protein